MKKAFCMRGSLAATLLAVTLLTAGPRPLSADPAATASTAPAPIAAPAVAPRPAAPPAHAPGGALTAILLVAGSVVTDPNFSGSIVLVMNNLGPAPVGVIINRPMPLPVSRFFPRLQRLARAPNRMYYGGPVEFGSAWFLFRAGKAPARAVRVCDGVYVSSDRRLLQRLLARPDPMRGLRIFLGHAGWAPGQLQMEIQGGAWSPRRAAAKAIFDPRPLRPWPAPRGSRPGT